MSTENTPVRLTTTVVGGFRRQTRCGHCHQIGHNRRTCPVAAPTIIAQHNLPTERDASSSPEQHPRTDPPQPHPQPVSEATPDLNDILNDVIPESICVADPDEQDDCPICLSSFEKTNVFVPKCGHKVCGDCFFTNIRTNKHTGTSCPMCRQTTVPPNTFTTVRRVARRSPNNEIPRRPLSEVANAVQSEINLLNHSVRPFRPEAPVEGEVGENYYNFITNLRNKVAPEVCDDLEVLLDHALVDIGFHFTVRSAANRRTLISEEGAQTAEALYSRWNNELF